MTLGRLVLRAEDKTARGQAKKLGLEVVVTDSWEVSGPTLFATVPIPWGLVPAGFHFLERWDAAAPLWRYGVLAATLGTPAERQRTEAITRDLRLLVYAPELLFVRASPAGRALVETWRAECQYGDERLAFIRALYLIKPIFCALPRTWLAELAAKGGRGQRPATRAPLRMEPRSVVAGRDQHSLVTVQIGPNQFVKCKPGDEGQVQRRFKEMAQKREERRKRK
jgi:hypothetical protein